MSEHKNESLVFASNAKKSSRPPARRAIRRVSSSKQAQVKKRKMVIKPFKVQPKPPEEFETKTFSSLEAAIADIHAKRPTETSQEELYRGVESLCRHRKDEALYKLVVARCDQHISGLIRSLYERRSTDLFSFLEAAEVVWKDHCNQMITVRSVFLYLDRTYMIQRASQVPDQPRSLWDLGLNLFQKHFTGQREVYMKTVRGLIDMIERERSGESIKRPLVQSLCHMFIALKVYKVIFEKDFLERTAAYYEAEGTRLIQELSVAEYVLHVFHRFQQERERVQMLLDAQTKTPLLELLEVKLVRAHVDALLANGFDKLMDDNRKQDLGRLYFLLSKIGEGALAKMKDSLHRYIKGTGTQLVSSPDRDKRLVQDLLDFRAKLDTVVSEAFNNNLEFKYALKAAFEHIINLREHRVAELIARFTDAKLRSSSKGMTHEELEHLLGCIVHLFRYIHGKDVFEAFYKKHLAKRLLVGTSASKDAEKSMIQKLKSECGSSFTKKLEGMFRDIDNSAEFMQLFTQFAKDVPDVSPTELHVRVLTMGSWPEYVPCELKVPDSVAAKMEMFRQFYVSKHHGRKLTWQHQLATCILRANFRHGRRELSVSAHQATVLMLFNDNSSLTSKQIRDMTKMELPELRRTLESLAHTKQARILIQKPLTKKISPTDVFSVNVEFRSKLFRVKVPGAQLRETKAEQKQTTERVFADRQYAIDACIVRIMKTRKTLSHSDLMAQTMEQLKFPSTPQDVKRRIGSLIEREYLERSSEDARVYNYVA